MKILERIKADDEIQMLRKSLYELTGQSLGFNYDCYLSIDEYKEHLRECVEAGEIIIRPKDEKAMHRFDAILKK